MNALQEATGGKPRPRQPAARVRFSAFSWSLAARLPMLKQTRCRNIGDGACEFWMEINL